MKNSKIEKRFQTAIRDIFEQGKADVICITTNGFVKRDGTAVMGAGVAKAIALKVPGIKKILGTAIKNNGNITQILLSKKKRKDGSEITIIALPSKPIMGTNVLPRYAKKTNGKLFPGWGCYSDVALIERSLSQLVELTNVNNWKKVLLTPVGCANGQLSWIKDIKQICDKLLDERFVIVGAKSTLEN